MARGDVSRSKDGEAQGAGKGALRGQVTHRRPGRRALLGHALWLEGQGRQPRDEAIWEPEGLTLLHSPKEYPARLEARPTLHFQGRSES